MENFELMVAELNVNIDHVATLRQARLIDYPDPVEAALLSEKAGAHGIVAHLREDRRHIQDRDIYNLKEKISGRLDLEMAHRKEIIKLALDIQPDLVTLVPEGREELTTEGGLDLLADVQKYKEFCIQMHESNIKVSFFVEPDNNQIDAAKECGAEMVELHTGNYANFTGEDRKNELHKIRRSSVYANQLGLEVAAGHGLNNMNLTPMASLGNIKEFSIGHALISRAVFIGLEKAVKELLDIIKLNSPA